MDPHTTLADNELHFLTFPLSDDGALAASDNILSKDEIERAARFVFDRDRNRYRVGRTHLRNLLARYTGVSAAALQFHYNPFGKPSIDGHLSFNISHSEDMMAAVVARNRDVGVDIERMRTINDLDGMARISFTDEEREWLAVQPEGIRTESFFRLWTRKEALLKAAGVGFGIGDINDIANMSPLKPLQIQQCMFRTTAWTCVPVFRIDGFAASVCHATEEDVTLRFPDD